MQGLNKYKITKPTEARTQLGKIVFNELYIKPISLVIDTEENIIRINLSISSDVGFNNVLFIPEIMGSIYKDMNVKYTDNKDLSNKISVENINNIILNSLSNYFGKENVEKI